MGFYLIMHVLVKCLLSLLAWEPHKDRDLSVIYHCIPTS